LDVDHPVIHLIVYPDGSTNQPSPKIKQTPNGELEKLFALRADHLSIVDGELLLNERRIPLEVDANRVAASMAYIAAPENGYKTHVEFGRVRFQRAGAEQVLAEGQTDFLIQKNAVHISSLQWTSGKSRMQASGTVTDLRSPRIEATYTGTVELRSLGNVLGIPQLRDGTAEFSGTLRYVSSEDFFSSGHLRLTNGAYSAPELRLADVDATSDYTIDVDRITIMKLNGHAFGGSFTGGANLLHWIKLVPKSEIGTGARRKLAAKSAEGSVLLSVSGMHLGTALRAVLPANSPVNRLRIASRAQGSVAIRWIGSPKFADAAVDLSAESAALVQPSELPLRGLIQATYHGREDRINVTGLTLASRMTRVNATGAIGVQSQLRLSVNTSDLADLEPVMRAFGAQTQTLPAVVHGQASFNGTATGKLASPTIHGHLQATDFDTLLPSYFGVHNRESISAASRNGQLLRWDSFDADISYSPTSVWARNIVLKHGKAQILGTASASLRNGQFAVDLPIEAHLRLLDNDIAGWQTIAGTSYPIAGRFGAQVTLSGTEQDLRGRGHVQVTGGAIYGELFRTLSADAQLRNQRVDFRNISLQQDGGHITGAATYDVTSQAFTLNLVGNDFELAHIARLQSKRLPVGGRAQFMLTGSGTLSEPSLNAQISVRNLVLGGEQEGDLVATAVTHGANLHVEAGVNTQIASANLNGDINLRGDWPAELHLDLAKLDFDPLLRVYLPGKLTGHSSMSGKLTLRGPLKRPNEIVITGDIDQFATDIQNIKLRNQGPLRFSVGNGTAKIDQMHIVGTDTDITGSGTVELSGTRRLDLHGNGHLNLAVLESFNSSISSSGQVTFTVNATGKVDSPSLAGNVQIADGTVSLTNLPNGLSAINGTLTFDTNRLRVQRLTAKTGGGDLVLGGYITYANGIFFDLSATGHDIRIRYPEGVSSQATADLRLVGTAQNSVLSGDVTITKFGLTPQFDLATYVQRAKQTPAPPNPNSLVDNIRLDVHIVSTPELRVETSMARLSGDVDIRLRGTAARPSVMGRVSIAEGDITFNSTTYHLERGDVVFANPVRIEPVINVEASARVRDYDITLGFHGTPDKLNITYRSEPPLPSEDIIALLAFGRTRQETEVQAEQGSQAATGESFAQSASSAILGEALNAAVSSRVQKLFGISRIKIDPNLGGTEGNPNARLTVEQQISKDLTVTYLTNLGQYAQEVVQVEYNINRNVSLVAVRDYTGVLAIDLRVRQRKR
jgi:translocation and assembly module TamB